MSQLFKNDFGITPFVVVDHGYGVPTAGDGQFQWYTLDLPNHISNFTTESGIHLSNFMAKWDSTGRDHPGEIATPTLNPARLTYKGPEILKEALTNSEATDIVFIATWNDLGEGTGVNRNYDYYYKWPLA